MFKTEEQMQALVKKAKAGDQAAFSMILKELEYELKKLVKQFYISGADADDTLQEAYIGVWKAVDDWTVDGGMSFRNFAIKICCKRHLITAMTSANRKKYDLLNKAISLTLPLSPNGDDHEQYWGDFIPDEAETPAEQYISQEEYSSYSLKICNKLTKLENKIFIEYMKGQTYSEIAETLNIKTKAVDNALMRIRKKASALWIGGTE